jgi:hypothetical protein
VAYAELAALDCITGRLDKAAAFWDENDATVRAFLGLEWPRELALLRAELWLWLGRAADALADALIVLEPLSATEESHMSGGCLSWRCGRVRTWRSSDDARGDDAMVSSKRRAARGAARAMPRNPFSGGRVSVTKARMVRPERRMVPPRRQRPDHGDGRSGLTDLGGLAAPDTRSSGRRSTADVAAGSYRSRTGPCPAAESARTHVPLSQAIADQRGRPASASPARPPGASAPATSHDTVRIDRAELAC